MVIEKSGFTCFGHRGAMGYEPENTLRAIRRALQLGVDWVEVDVHLVDGELIVIHDDTLDRTTNGRGSIYNQSFESLRSLDAGKGERIPTLDEVFECVDGRAGINVELKGPQTAVAVVRFIHDRPRRGFDQSRVLVSSFDHAQLAEVKTLDRSVRTGALMEQVPDESAAVAEHLGCVSLHIPTKAVSSRLIEDAHRRNLKVFVYTVNDALVCTDLMGIGIDGVFSDVPDVILACFSE